VRLLVVEDDPDLNRQLTTALTDAGYVVDRAFDGEEGIFSATASPTMQSCSTSGCPRWTASRCWKPGAATACDAGTDPHRARPLELTRCRVSTPAPMITCENRFISRKVLARIRALLRRSTGHAQSELTCGPVSLDTRTGRFSVSGNPIKMTSHEYRLLAYLMHHTGRVGVAHRTGRASLRSGF